MKLKKIRNALLVVLTLALVSATTVAITWAYLNSTFTEAKNTFTNNETINIDITEPDWAGEIETGKEYTEANGYNPGDAVTSGITKGTNNGAKLADGYYEGLDIPKDPRITNTSNPNTTDADVKAASTEIIGAKLQYVVKDDSTEYVYPSYGDFKDSVATVKFSTSKTDDYNTAWAAFDDTKLYLYHKAPIGWKGQTAHIFDWVTINDVTELGDGETLADDIPADAKGIYTDGTNYSVRVYNADAGEFTRITLTTLPKFDIKITGYAVQSNPISDSLTDISGSGDTNKAARNALRALMGLTAES